MSLLDYLDPLQSGLPVTLMFLTITISLFYLMMKR
jgi:hypothetical protein